VLCSTKQVRIRVYLMLSFSTKIAIRRVWRCHRLRCYMVVGVEPHYFEIMVVERKVFFGPDLLQGAEIQVHSARENMRIAQLRQKSYVDHR
jgi:hypothetical protein